MKRVNRHSADNVSKHLQPYGRLTETAGSRYFLVLLQAPFLPEKLGTTKLVKGKLRWAGLIKSPNPQSLPNSYIRLKYIIGCSALPGTLVWYRWRGSTFVLLG